MDDTVREPTCRKIASKYQGKADPSKRKQINEEINKAAAKHANNKQLLDEVFVISGIIKVKGSVIT